MQTGIEVGGSIEFKRLGFTCSVTNEQWRHLYRCIDWQIRSSARYDGASPYKHLYASTISLDSRLHQWCSTLDAGGTIRALFADFAKTSLLQAGLRSFQSSGLNETSSCKHWWYLQQCTEIRIQRSVSSKSTMAQFERTEARAASPFEDVDLQRLRLTRNPSGTCWSCGRLWCSNAW